MPRRITHREFCNAVDKAEELGKKRVSVAKTKEVLKQILLPANCKCGHFACNTTHDFRFTHAERDAVKEAIEFYLLVD
jgi:hypothetical protein